MEEMDRTSSLETLLGVDIRLCCFLAVLWFVARMETTELVESLLLRGEAKRVWDKGLKREPLRGTMTSWLANRETTKSYLVEGIGN